MRKKRIWYKANSLLEAKRYITKSEFWKNSPAAYSACLKFKWLEEASKHMVPSRLMTSKRTNWTKEKCIQEAKKYKFKSDFIRKSPGAYAASKRLGCVKEVTRHLKVILKRDWDKESCRLEALKYISRKDFNTFSKGAYIFSGRRRWMDEICSHMKSDIIYWNEELVRKEAGKYKSRKEFHRNCGSGYGYANKNGLLDDVCSHMEILGNSFNRLIYAYEFSDRHVYVGLTFNEKKRISEHLSGERGPVAKHILKTGIKPKYKKLSDYLPREKARMLEHASIERYRLEGWVILNANKAGALGGNAIKWTKEECIRVAKLYQTRTEFEHSRVHYTGYSAAAKHGWLDDVCKHMKRLRMIRWTKEEVLKEAKKYKYRIDFMRKSWGAYNNAARNGFREEACAHMKVLYKSWTKEGCRKAASKFQYKIDFQKQNLSAYQSAVRRGWYKEIGSHLKNKFKRWDEYKCRIEAQKYQTRKEFQIGSGAAYNHARKNGFLDRIGLHFIRKRA